MKEKQLIQFINMISEKICHDMAGPINSFSCAMDMVSVDNAIKDDFLKDKSLPEEKHRDMAISIAKDSSIDTVNKLKFIRDLYGHTDDSILEDKQEVIAMLNSILHKRGMNVRIIDKRPSCFHHNEFFNSSLKQILLNLVTVICDSIVNAKEIVVYTLIENDTKVIKIEFSGSKPVKIKKFNNIEILSSEKISKDMSLYSVYPEFVRTLLKYRKCSIEFEENNDYLIAKLIYNPKKKK